MKSSSHWKRYAQMKRINLLCQLMWVFSDVALLYSPKNKPDCASCKFFGMKKNLLQAMLRWVFRVKATSTRMPERTLHCKELMFTGVHIITQEHILFYTILKNSLLCMAVRSSHISVARTQMHTNTDVLWGKHILLLIALLASDAYMSEYSKAPLATIFPSTLL